MPTVKYILKKTVGSLEREIKYCTYWKTSARIPIKVKPEKTKHNRKDLMTVFTLSLHLCCRVCSGAWPWPHCSQHFHRPRTHMISVTNSVLLTRGQAPPAAVGAPLALGHNVFQFRKKKNAGADVSYSAQSCLGFAVSHLPLDYLQWSQTAFIFSENF